MILETVKIVSPVSDDNPAGYIVINKSDLVDGMTIFKEPAPMKVDVSKKTETPVK